MQTTTEVEITVKINTPDLVQNRLQTIIGWGFCDIQNNQGRGKSYQPKPKAEADNPYRDLDYSGYHKNQI